MAPKKPAVKPVKPVKPKMAPGTASGRVGNYRGQVDTTGWDQNDFDTFGIKRQKQKGAK